MRALVLVLIMLLSGCMAAAGPVNKVMTGTPGSLYRVKCAACHRIYPPENYTYQKLQSYATKYGKGLSVDERQRLLEYLKDNAKQE